MAFERSSSGVTARTATFDFLRASNMTTVFGNPGSTELRFMREWPSDFRYVTALHEASAVAMADGYAQVARACAFVNLHSAGGVGNAMGSVFSAYKNQTPLVVTAGQQTRALLPSEPFLYAQDATLLPRPYVKWACEPARGEDVPAAIAHAYYVAMQRPCGPTFVSIPEDDWDVPAETPAIRRFYAEMTAERNALADVSARLAACSRPALVVGPGVDRDDASGAAIALAERVQAPVWISPLSNRCSFPERHPLFGGFLPPVRASIARILNAYDLVLVLGAPVFTYHVHSAGVPHFVADIVHLSDDPAALAAAPAGTAIVTTLRSALEQLLEVVAPTGRAAPRTRPAPARLAATDPLTPGYALQTIREHVARNVFVFEEAPSHRNALHEYFPVEDAGTFFNAASGSLGWALPAAVGAALAAPGRRVVALVGDGSAMYSIQALWTAARFALPVTFVVLNNASYAAMNEFSRYLHIEGAPSFALTDLDIVRCAQGFGCAARRVTAAAELPAALEASLATAGPALLDIVVENATGTIY
ncbi:MAG: benzoylformate decarboxylase [Candidatus Eremiobacteraeota bacterium]|nr:benzoylformate decarboxylase [Candidatus Eremiobacteraeota bacterium]